MRVVFAESAERDLNNIVDYIASDNPIAAEKIYRTIVAAVGRLPRHPEMGRPGRVTDTRELMIPSLPYIVVYEIGHDRLTILAVFQTA